MLDTAYTVETPDGVEVTLRPAGPAVRCLAFLLDVVLRYALLMFGVLLFGRLGDFGTGLFLVLMFSVFWLYPVAFEQLWHGQTPGKRLFGLRVLMANGTPVTMAGSLLRNLLLVVDFLPVLFAAGGLCMGITRRLQRIGDVVGDTVVVHLQGGAKADDGLPEVAGRRPPPVRLGAAEQQLLLAWAERVPALSPARREELAVLSGLTSARGEAAVEELLQMAHGLAGSGQAADGVAVSAAAAGQAGTGTAAATS